MISSLRPILVIGSYQKKKTRKRGIKGARPGSVTFIQRFGSALNLNVHFHALFADGVFYKTSADRYEFYRLPTPSHEELGLLVTKIHDKVMKLTKKLGLDDQDQMALDESGLSESFPNMLICKMKTPWRDGTTHVSFSPLDFIARLVALIPPAKMNMIRYHGVFASNFKDRQLIVPKKPKPAASASEESPQIHEKARRERMRWSEMLKRTFKIDVTICPHCGGRLEQIAVIKDRTVAKAILESLNETTLFSPLKFNEVRGHQQVKILTLTTNSISAILGKSQGIDLYVQNSKITQKWAFILPVARACGGTEAV